MKKVSALLVVSLAIAVMLSGCLGGAKQPQTPAAPAGPYPLTLTDDAGRTVEIKAEPESYVSLIPSLTEILFALGLGSRVVGVTTFCNYPAETQAIEKIGDAWAPNLEKVIALEPDVVLSAQGASLSETAAALEKNNINVLVYDPKSIEQILQVIREVAKLANVGDKGEALAAQIAEGKKAIDARVAGIKESERPRVFVLLDTEYIYTVGDGEYISEMIVAAGGINAASGQGQGYPLLSEEVFFEIDPDIIICTFPMSEQVKAKAAWRELSAIKNGRVYDVDGDLVSRPGPRLVEGLEELYRVFYK